MNVEYNPFRGGHPHQINGFVYSVCPLYTLFEFRAIFFVSCSFPFRFSQTVYIYIARVLYASLARYVHVAVYTRTLINLFRLFRFLPADLKKSSTRESPKTFKAGYRYFQTVFPSSVTSVHKVSDRTD